MLGPTLSQRARQDGAPSALLYFRPSTGRDLEILRVKIEGPTLSQRTRQDGPPRVVRCEHPDLVTLGMVNDRLLFIVKGHTLDFHAHRIGAGNRESAAFPVGSDDDFAGHGDFA